MRLQGYCPLQGLKPVLANRTLLFPLACADISDDFPHLAPREYTEGEVGALSKHLRPGIR